jgi:hypothetical protein
MQPKMIDGPLEFPCRCGCKNTFPADAIYMECTACQKRYQRDEAVERADSIWSQVIRPPASESEITIDAVEAKAIGTIFRSHGYIFEHTSTGRVAFMPKEVGDHFAEIIWHAEQGFCVQTVCKWIDFDDVTAYMLDLAACLTILRAIKQVAPHLVWDES